MPRERKPTDRFTLKELGGTNPTPPAEPTKKKPKYYYEEIKDDGSSASFLTGGYMPILAPTSAVAETPDVVVISDDDDEEEDEDDTFRLQRPYPLVLSHLYNNTYIRMYVCIHAHTYKPIFVELEVHPARSHGHRMYMICM